jgi:phage tail sheath protein FI
LVRGVNNDGHFLYWREIMPARLTYPGVYVEEKRSGVRTISGVDTSITLFLGMARRGPVGEPRAVRSVDQFEQTYGDDPTYGELATQVRQFYLNGGASAVIVRLGGAGIAPASVTLQSEAGLPVLVLTAKDDGALGSQIRVEVDVATPTPQVDVQPCGLSGGRRRQRQRPVDRA